MTERRSLKALQAQIKQESNSQGNNGSGSVYPFWKQPENAKSSFRILEDPDMDNPFIVYTHLKSHTLNIGDEFKTVTCPTTFKDRAECPICDLSRKFYNAKENDTGKYYYRRLEMLMRAVVTHDSMVYDDVKFSKQDKVVTIKCGKQVSDALNNGINTLEEDEGEFWKHADGTDFNIVRTVGSDTRNKFDSSSTFARRQSALTPDQILAADANTGKLSELIDPAPSYDELVDLLNKHLNAGELKQRGAAPTEKTPESSRDAIKENLARQRADSASDTPPAEASTPEAAADVPPEAKTPTVTERANDILANINLDDDDDDGASIEAMLAKMKLKQ